MEAQPPKQRNETEGLSPVQVLTLVPPSLSILRYLIRPDPLAHVPDEPSVKSSSLKETYESSIDAAEDLQL